MAKSKRTKARSKKPIRRKGGILKIVSRFSVRQMAVFVLIFAAFGTYLIYRGMAADPVILMDQEFRANDSLGAALITETRANAKRDKKVVSLTNEKENCPVDVAVCARAGFANAMKTLEAGTYEACVVGLALQQGISGTLEIRILLDNQPAGLITSSEFTLTPLRDYSRTGCSTFTIGAKTEVFTSVINRTPASTLQVGSVIIAPKGTVREVYSARDGNWSDPATWSGGRVPQAINRAIISHNVTYDVANSQITGMTIRAGGTLSYDVNSNGKLQSNANVIVNGTLQMRPASASVRHTLTFTQINENKFEGGGMDPKKTDIGLWVIGDGMLDIEGSTKTSWTRLSSSAPAGATQIGLVASPTGWMVGDQLIIVPTNPGDTKSFDFARVKSINSNAVELDRPLPNSHPRVNNQWGAEVLNLSRNVTIEGSGSNTETASTDGGRTHIFIRSTKPQNIKYLVINATGPRPNYISRKRPVGSEQTWPPHIETTGRYALHFHHSGDGSRGSVVEGTVVTNAGSHAYVPHTSHGITFKNTISYNTFHTSYWWDGPSCPRPCNSKNFRNYQKGPEITHNTTYENTVAARVKSGSDNFRLSGYELGKGSGNKITGSVVVGVEETMQGGGFKWPEGVDSVWGFKNNLAHNNGKSGIFAWQNNSNRNHKIENFTAYHNQIGIHHGAYTNNYKYFGGILYGNSRTGILLEAVPREENIVFDGITIDAARIGESAIETLGFRACRQIPTVFKNITMRNFTDKGAIHLRSGGENCARLDFINPAISGNAFYRSALTPGSVVRVQNGSSAYQVSTEQLDGSAWVPEWNAYRKTIPTFQ